MLVQDGESSFWQNGRRELKESYLLFRMIFFFSREGERKILFHSRAHGMVTSQRASAPAGTSSSTPMEFDLDLSTDLKGNSR